MDDKSSAGIELLPITKRSVTRGGYSIKYKGTLPAKARLWLGIEGKPDLQVTDRGPDALLGPDNLPAFLAVIGKSGLWGKRARCRLYIERDNKVVARSNEESFDCPVRPYVGRLGPEMGLRTGVYSDPRDLKRGRYLSIPPIDGCYYFLFNDQFETDESLRGLNCITYAGAVFGVSAKSKRAVATPGGIKKQGALAGRGGDLAKHLDAKVCTMLPASKTTPAGGASAKPSPSAGKPPSGVAGEKSEGPVLLENVDGSVVKEFFRANPKGTFLLWKSSHVVVVVNGVVHEFAQSRKGYATTAIEKHALSGKWSVARTPRQF